MIGSSSSKLSGFGEMKNYTTGWVNCSDWTDQQLGDTVGSNVNHSLNTNLSNLIVKIFISTDGTENNSFEIIYGVNEGGGLTIGISIEQVDANNITVQTGSGGLRYISGSGSGEVLDTENWYYKISVYKVAGNN